MLSIAKVFRDFKDFYSEINAATLTGAIDVIIVEQPDGSFHCSPFHVRFGKLGVLRSREKVVDIEVNGEAVDIQMKLGESGEAFFVEECTEGELEVLPQHFATSPIPTNELSNFEDSINQSNEIKCPIPRRNSIDLSKDIAEMESIKFENQTSDYSHRRHTDNTMERRDLSTNIIEFTTKKLRDEYPVEQDQLYDEIKEKVNLMKNMDDDSKIFRPITEQDGLNDSDKSAKSDTKADDNKLNQNLVKDDGKSKKKRRKKSVMKKKNNQRKNSTSSSTGSVNSDPNEPEVTETMTISSATNASTSTDGSPNTDNDVLLVTLPNDESKNVEIKKEPEVKRMRDLDIHFFSDTEVGSGSPRGSRPSTPVQSDTEFEVSQREKKDDVMTSSASWKWGELPTSEDPHDTSAVSESTKRNSMLSGMLSFMKQTNKMRKNIPEGLYLSDLDAEGMDPEVAALYFPQSGVAHQHKEGRREEDRESGNGTSLPQSPTTSMEMIKSMDSDFDDQKVGADSYLNFVSLSLCGGMEKGGPTEDEFESQLVQYSDICMNPALFSSPNLVVRLNQKYYTWATACPLVMTLLAYQKPLPLEVCDKLVGSANSSMEEVKLEPQHTAENNRRSWFLWRRSGGGSVQEKKTTMKSVESIDKEQSVATQTSPTPLIKDANKDSTEIFNVSVSSEESFALKNQEVADLTDMQQNKNTLTLNTEKFRKTLRLSSDQIEKLNLKNGMNEIEFSVTTAYQGTSRCKCYLFKWKHNDKVVISDIDGTITKSDVLGHILPMVGKDWAQIGVAQLFSKIEENGYKMLYLSARAIGQSRATREYLRSIRQGDVKLPDGPLLLNPTSLISAFHREVIERKPEQFKIECLSDIKSLFDDKNPFYAGYGNRINDVWAYRAVGIPIMRIYTINPRGELKHELTQTFQSTYCSMTFIVDQLFPPIKLTDEDDDIEYTSFNYWRDPVADMEIEIPVAAPGSPGSSTATTGDASKDPTKVAAAAAQVIQSKPLPTIPEN